MLMSAKLPPSKQIWIHGFITSGGQKMSKSLGNVIDPLTIVSEYSTDVLRYFLARHIHPFEDSDFTMERFKDAYNGNLANGLGNQVSRIMKLAETHLVSPVTVTDEPLEATFCEKLDTFLVNEALDHVFAHIQKGDEFIQSSEPYKRIKSEDEMVREGARADIEKLVRHVYKVAKHLEPFMPETSRKIIDAVKRNKMPAEPLFLRKE